MWPLISPASGALSSFILALISEWPVFHITGLAPAFVERLGQHLRALDVEDDRRAAAESLHRVAAEDDQELVAVDDLAGLVHRADPVGVSVERDAELGAGPAHRGLKVPQILRDGGIGMVIGKASVRFAEQRRHFGAEAASVSTAIRLPTPLPQSTTTWTGRSSLCRR